MKEVCLAPMDGDGETGTVAAMVMKNDGSSASPSDGNMDALCMACEDASCDFKPKMMARRALGPRDILIEMKYCGVCHSDLHHAANHNSAFNQTKYPCVPGHELAGIVTACGKDCTKISVGMRVGVGCIVDSCLECKMCLAGEEQKCLKGMVGTYGAIDKHGRAMSPVGHTLGGYTSSMVVHEHFAIIIPETFDLKAAGPVMCAGITMYDPLVKLGAADAPKRVGIVGLGGLGVMGIKLAKALGCTVTAISRSSNKEKFAKSHGADTFIATSETAQLKAAAGSLDIILNTIPVYHEYDIFTRLCAKGGKQVLLGLHKGLIAGFLLEKMMRGRNRVTFSGIGGIRNTQAVVDLCAAHGIVPEIHVMACEQINEIYTKLDGANDAGVRYVLDIGSSLNDTTLAKCTQPSPTLAKPTGTMSVPGGAWEALRLFVTGRA